MGNCLEGSRRNNLTVTATRATRPSQSSLPVHVEPPYEPNFEYVSPYSFDHHLFITGYMRELTFSFNIPSDVIQLISTFYPSYQVLAIGNQEGEFGIGTEFHQWQFVKSYTLSACIHSIDDVYASKHRLMIVNYDDMCCVGSNRCFELGLGSQQPRNISCVCKVKAKDLGIGKIGFFSSGLSSECSFAVDANSNKIVCWGRYGSQQLGIDKGVERYYDSRIAQPTELAFNFQSCVVQICCGRNFTIFRCANGLLYFCGLAFNMDTITPVLIEFENDERIIAVDCGSTHALFIDSNHKVFGFGVNKDGCIEYGNQDTEVIDTPRMISFFENMIIKKVCCGSQHSAVMDHFGFVYLFGDNNNGQIGNDGEELTEPYKLQGSNGDFMKADDVSLGDEHSLILTHDNEVYSFGSNGSGQCSPCWEDDADDNKGNVCVPYWLQRDEIGIADSCVIARVIAGIQTTFIFANY